MQEDFKSKLEKISVPDTSSIRAPEDLKLTLLNANKTAAIGAWLIAIPAYFLFCVFMKYYFHYNLHIFDIIIEMMSNLDKTPGLKFLSPLLLAGFPLVCIVLNMLAIVHFGYNKNGKELLLSIKLKWLNIFLIIFCATIAGIFFIYAIFENAHHSMN